MGLEKNFRRSANWKLFNLERLELNIGDRRWTGDTGSPRKHEFWNFSLFLFTVNCHCREFLFFLWSQLKWEWGMGMGFNKRCRGEKNRRWRRGWMGKIWKHWGVNIVLSRELHCKWKDYSGQLETDWTEGEMGLRDEWNILMGSGTTNVQTGIIGKGNIIWE